MDLKEDILHRAKKIGIDIIGFSNCEAFDGLRDKLLLRRRNKKDTEFEENDIELRTKPKRLMSKCKSIIAIGISYNVDVKDNITSDVLLKSHKGNLSRSSWGIDYHIILKNKLEELAKEIKKVVNFNYKVFVDTGPLVDREIAKRSGIGWYGKNNSIINDKYGSFIFIGYMLTDIDLEPDRPIDNKCGFCTNCIDACPTGAIEGNNIVNARRCISYLTQTKEKIPYELREKMGTKIYGCDTCQLVCPINKKTVLGENESFYPKITNGKIELRELFNMSNREFKKKYGHMAGSWRGKNILKRNCIIAMGNIKDKENLDFIIKGLEDQSSIIREYSAWALLKIDKGLGIKLIRKYIDKEKEVDVKNELIKLLKYFEGDNK
ncbi:tRNA epoxyqueuosine(34) reductase QueG [Sporosalibacterium faouarense]|uniref:tRNA epoxyqueuosine(34) reductase QueG n=1 Tax=Sporosalibacterium faouarense TaxID=516123 RepID=UPI00141CE157|nr:tRNA epoxyqueuosine(34) reductase QueG [Sporosalibacterium faouarense]MTI47000.1 tRNA epoxyqueuosine(34) reductase QueG [Bacillota bacterium]